MYINRFDLFSTTNRRYTLINRETYEVLSTYGEYVILEKSTPHTSLRKPPTIFVRLPAVCKFFINYDLIGDRLVEQVPWREGWGYLSVKSFALGLKSESLDSNVLVNNALLILYDVRCA